MFLSYGLQYDNIQCLPLSEGDMTICSPEAGDIVRGRIVMSPSLKGNNCFIITNPFETNYGHATGQTHVTTSATAHLGEYDIRG